MAHITDFKRIEIQETLKANSVHFMIDSRFSELRQKLTEALGRNQARAILVSGGIDSGILAYLSPPVKGVTVNLKGKGEDLKYVSILRNSLDLDVTLVKVGVDEAFSAVRKDISLLEILNFEIEQKRNKDGKGDRSKVSGERELSL